MKGTNGGSLGRRTQSKPPQPKSGPVMVMLAAPQKKATTKRTRNKMQTQELYQPSTVFTVGSTGSHQQPNSLNQKAKSVASDKPLPRKTRFRDSMEQKSTI